MRRLGLALVLFLPAGPVIGQIVQDTITIASTRTVYTQPDQAVVGLVVTSIMPIGLGEALAVLQGSGITASNLAGTDGLSWSFTMPVAFSQLQQTLASLAGLQQSISQKSPGLTLAIGVSGTQISTALQQSQPCGTSDLLADATGQAQKLANVSGLTLGPVVALVEGGSGPFAVVREQIGIFTFNSGTVVSPSANCSLTVTFKIIRTR